jgi:hypothetical protein
MGARACKPYVRYFFFRGAMKALGRAVRILSILWRAGRPQLPAPAFRAFIDTAYNKGYICIKSKHNDWWTFRAVSRHRLGRSFI